jgi:hypothetical protein
MAAEFIQELKVEGGEDLLKPGGIVRFTSHSTDPSLKLGYSFVGLFTHVYWDELEQAAYVNFSIIEYANANPRSRQKKPVTLGLPATMVAELLRGNES